MKLEISVSEVVDLFKEIQEQPEQLFEMIRSDMRQTIETYLSELMDAELTHFLGRKCYERRSEDGNHRNGTYDRVFSLKGVGNWEKELPFNGCRLHKSRTSTQIIRYHQRSSRSSARRRMAKFYCVFLLTFLQICR